MHPIAIPTAAHIAAALESLLDQATRQRNTTRAKALQRAAEDIASGLMPLESDAGYLVRSASELYAYHAVVRIGSRWVCGCQARGYCRHLAMVEGIEWALELLEQGLLGDTHGDDSGPIVVTPAPGGLNLSRGGTAIECHTPEDVAAAVRSLTARLCAARAEYLAA